MSGEPSLLTRRPMLEFNRKIDAGHVLQIGTILVLSIIAFATMRERQQSLERDMNTLSKTLEREQLRSNENIRDLRLDMLRQMAQIQSTMDRLADKLDKKADK